MRDNTFWYGEVRRETAYLRIPTDSYSVERIYHLEGNRTDKIIMITRPHITSLSEKEFGGSYDTIIHEVSEDNSVYHSPIEIFNLIMESKKISPNTKLNYKRTKELLIEFAPLASYQDIDKRFIRAFEIYLTRKNLCANTILKYLKCLKRALRLAQQTGQIKETIEELFSLTVTKAEIIRKESLTPHELNKLQEYLRIKREFPCL